MNLWELKYQGKAQNNCFNIKVEQYNLWIQKNLILIVSPFMSPKVRLKYFNYTDSIVTK